MKQIFILLCFICTFNFGCSKKDCCVIINRNISISYVDAKSADLLDPANANTIKAADIEIYYLENGNKKRVYNGRLDTPKNFRILKTPNNTTYYLSLLLSESLNEKNLSTTYLEVKKYNFTDTITATINKTRSSSQVGSVWFNGMLKGDAIQKPITFTIVK